jgi:hypothetical protein
MKAGIFAIANALPGSVRGANFLAIDATVRDTSAQPPRGLNLSTPNVQRLFCKCSSIIQRKSLRNALFVLFMSLIGVCMDVPAIATRVIPA